MCRFCQRGANCVNSLCLATARRYLILPLNLFTSPATDNVNNRICADSWLYCVWLFVVSSLLRLSASDVSLLIMDNWEEGEIPMPDADHVDIIIA